MALSPVVIVASLAAFLYATTVALFLYQLFSKPYSVGKRIGLACLVIFVPIIGWGLFFLFAKEEKPAEKVSEQKEPLAAPKLSGEPEFSIETQGDIPRLPDLKDKTQINVRYPLLPPYAYAHIYWDAPTTELVYAIEEPELDAEEQKILATLEEGIKELINLSFIKVKDQKTVFLYLEKNIKVLLTELSIKISQDTYMKLMYYIYRDFVGLNELEPLMQDYYIEDIECNGVDTPVYVVHRKYRNVRTTLSYPQMEKLGSFVEKLAQKCGKYVSYAEPLLDGSLPDGSRVNATYSTDVSSRGPTYTLRKFSKEPWSPIQLMQKGTVSPEMLAYLWMLIEYEHSFMVVGGTGSGKTTCLNILAFFIPPQARVVSIEDTKELQLNHENWLPSVARGGVGLTNLVGQRFGEVTLFDLLKESFRQRPDYVIVGEVRGKEAYVLFQGMASGHPSFGTMHAESVETLVRRLKTPPINLSGSLVESLHCVCVMAPVKVKGKPVRRLVKIDEVVAVPEGENARPETSPVFAWNPQNDTFRFNPNNRLFAKAAQQYGLTAEQILQEFRVRAQLLSTLYSQNIYGFSEVQKIVNEYYKSPNVILQRFKIGAAR